MCDNFKFKLFNTQSRKLESINSSSNNKYFNIYCCGPTVYGPAHIGNFRTYVVQDTIVRILNVLGIKYTYVRNLTDVDDKTIKGSISNNLSLQAYTNHWIESFHNDCIKLNLLPPSFEPKATETINEQQELINVLLKNGHAYTNNGSVYFKISSFSNYGQLSKVNERKLKTQAVNSGGKLNDADEYDREQIADFVLWKAYKKEDGNVYWDSPWGKGRPGWHIECSAMSHKFLGKTIDLHSGGIDLCFPHHENEIAQSEAAYGGPFVLHWTHIAHLQIDGKKMSKSLCNLLTLDDIAKQNYDGSIVRYALLSGHYRQPLNFTFDLLKSSKSAINKILNFVDNVTTKAEITYETFLEKINQHKFLQDPNYLSQFFEAILCDLNIPKALGTLFTLINKGCTFTKVQATQLSSELAICLYILGINFLKKEAEVVNIPTEIEESAKKRWILKQNKKYDEADLLRKIILDKGWEILDKNDGYIIQKIQN